MRFAGWLRCVAPRLHPWVAWLYRARAAWLSAGQQPRTPFRSAILANRLIAEVVGASPIRGYRYQTPDYRCLDDSATVSYFRVRKTGRCRQSARRLRRASSIALSCTVLCWHSLAISYGGWEVEKSVWTSVAGHFHGRAADVFLR